MEIDKKHIDELIKHYKFAARPSNTHSQAACTVEELNKAINETAKLISEIVKILPNN